MRVSVLRLGHRLVRDARISTHVGLVARAFGARELILSGNEDETANSLRRLSERWGGRFLVSYAQNWRKVLQNWRGPIVHLTMYGENIDVALPKIRRETRKSSLRGDARLLVVVGAEKVPSQVYRMCRFNVAIGNQPHSEVAALAIFLDRLYRGQELYYKFGNARVEILPSLRGIKKLKEVDST